MRHEILQRDHGCVFQQVVVLIAGGIMNSAGDRADLGVGLLHSDSVAEAGDSLEIVRRAAGILSVEIGGRPDGGVVREAEVARENSDHRVNDVIDLQVQLRVATSQPWALKLIWSLPSA